MLNYAAWIERAKAFLRRLPQLPGEIEIHDAIESPVNSAYDLELFASPRCPLPDAIRAFLTTASQRCTISYAWTPTVDILGGLNPRTSFSAFGDLCEFSRYSLAFRDDGSEDSSDLPGESMFDKLEGQLPDWLVNSMRTSAGTAGPLNSQLV